MDSILSNTKLTKDKLVNSVVIASIKPNGSFRTYGSGIVVLWKDSIFIITCIHVIEEMRGKKIHAILLPCKGVHPQKSNSIAELNNPNFHKLDNESGSFDIVAYKLEMNIQEIKQYGLTWFDLSNYKPTKLNGLNVKSCGFSSDYLRENYIQGSLDKLLPDKNDEQVMDVKVEALSLTSISRPLKEMSFCIPKTGVPIGKGMSGGPIVDETQNSLVGMIIASISGGVVPNQKVVGTVFVSTDRIIEVIK